MNKYVPPLQGKVVIHAMLDFSLLHDKFVC